MNVKRKNRQGCVTLADEVTFNKEISKRDTFGYKRTFDTFGY